MTTSRTITIDSFQFEYFIFGKGALFMLAFHGFGEDAQDLDLPEVPWTRSHTILAINHPYHGNSYTPDENTTLDPETLKKLVLELSIRHQFDQFSLLGYSLGAKMALKILEYYPDRIRHVFLFAPDGIVFNRWYNLVVHYKLSRKLFLYIIKNPDWFFNVVRTLRNLRFIPASLQKFVLLHMHTEEKRRMVYKVWHVNQLIVPDIKKIREQLKTGKTKVQLFFGKRDRIIPPSIGKYFCKGIEVNCQLTLLDCGHQMLTKNNLRKLKINFD